VFNRGVPFETHIARPWRYRGCTMAKKRATAEELVAASTRAGLEVTSDTRERIVGALTEDLGAAADVAWRDDDRRVRLEAQLLVLTDAITALTAAAHVVALAAQGVKDAM
jgi:hypothetical protein